MTFEQDLIATTQDHVITFLQEAEEPRPDRALDVLAYGAIDTIEEPQGEVEGVYRHSNTTLGDHVLVAELAGTPELPSFSIEQQLFWQVANYLESVKDSGMRFCLHVVTTKKTDKANETKWESKRVIEGVRINTFSSGSWQSNDGSNAVVPATGEATARRVAHARHMQASTLAGTEITAPIRGVAVWPPRDKGAFEQDKWIIAIQDVATDVKVHYSKNDGSTWGTSAITFWTLTEQPTDIKIVGDKVVAISNVGLGYAWCDAEDLVNGAAVWTEVTGGFVASKGPNAMFVKSPSEVFIAGDGGYVYKLARVGQPVTVLEAGNQTVQNLNSIHGYGDYVAAVGAANALILSSNKGRSWAAKTGPIAATVLNAVYINHEKAIFVGAANGELYWNVDTLATATWGQWTQPSVGAAITNVTAIIFTNESKSIGYVGFNTASTAHLWRTTDGGATWENDSLADFDTSVDSVEGLAVGGQNYVVAVGVNSTDGFLQRATKAPAQ